MGIKFKREISRAIGESESAINSRVTHACRMAYMALVSNTPKPPTPSGQKYQRTGRAVSGWKFNKGKNVGLIPAFGKYNISNVYDISKINFDVRKDTEIQFYNNVPYVPFLDKGLGPGRRIAYNMLEAGEKAFDEAINL